MSFARECFKEPVRFREDSEVPAVVSEGAREIEVFSHFKPREDLREVREALACLYQDYGTLPSVP